MYSYTLKCLIFKFENFLVSNPIKYFNTSFECFIRVYIGAILEHLDADLHSIVSMYFYHTFVLSHGQSQIKVCR